MKAAWQAGSVAEAPQRAAAMAVLALLGLVTGAISALPSPLPDLRLSSPDLFVSSREIPLHAGIVFGGMLAIMLWRWTDRDRGKALLVLGFTLIGWIAAVNTAERVFSEIAESALFGDAKDTREGTAWLLSGFMAGGVGASLTAFGAGIPALAIRRFRAWGPIVLVGAVSGLLLYPAAELDALILLYAIWQSDVAAAIGFAVGRLDGADLPSSADLIR